MGSVLGSEYHLLYMLAVDAVFIHRLAGAHFPSFGNDAKSTFCKNYRRLDMHSQMVGGFVRKTMQFGRYPFEIWSDARLDSLQRAALIKAYFAQVGGINYNVVPI